MDIQTKTCSRCKTTKQISDFRKRSGKRSHEFFPWCYPCVRAYGNAYMSKVYHRDPATWIARQKKRHAANPANVMLCSAKRRAAKKGLEFSLTLKDIEIPDQCPLLGIELIVTSGRVSDCTPTIDRIDNSKGYVPGNVWIISHKANTMKSNASLEDLETLTNNLRAKINVAKRCMGFPTSKQ